MTGDSTTVARTESDAAKTIAVRRPLADLLGVALGWAVAAAALFQAAPAPSGLATMLAFAAVAAWWLAVVLVIRSDLRDFLIPDGASAAIAIIGLVQAAAVPLLAGESLAAAGLAVSAALCSGLSVFMLFWLVGAGFRRFGSRDALGFGDVKLAGASAVWLTPGEAAAALEIAALGAMLALLLWRKRDGASLRDTAVPFGAFMAPAAWMVFVLGPTVGRIAGLSW